MKETLLIANLPMLYKQRTNIIDMLVGFDLTYLIDNLDVVNVDTLIKLRKDMFIVSSMLARLESHIKNLKDLHEKKY